MRSQFGVHNRIKILAQGLRVNSGQVATSRDEIGGRRTSTSTRPQLGNFGTIAGDNQGLAAHYPIQDLSAMIAQVAHGHRLHAKTVSPVIQVVEIVTPGPVGEL